MTIDRRNFLKAGSALGAGILLPLGYINSIYSSENQFKISLNPGSIGLKISQLELVKIAADHGFDAIIPYPEEILKMSDHSLHSLMAEMRSNNLTWDSTNLPVEFRNTEEQFQRDLKELPALAKAIQRAGAGKMNTWILSSHPTLTYRENFKRHTIRLKQVTEILADNNIQLGLEYVGPATSLIQKKFTFIHTLDEMQELRAEIGTDNVGIQLDSFHWYCAGETRKDILTLSKDEIITVDLNDARMGRTRQEQMDLERELPGATGLIDIQEFLGALKEIEYEGTVRAEPFNAKLNNMEKEKAVNATFEAMEKVCNS